MLIIISLTLTATHGSNYYYHLHLPYKETKACRGNLTYSKSCSEEMSELGFEPNPSDSKTQTLIALPSPRKGPLQRGPGGVSTNSHMTAVVVHMEKSPQLFPLLQCVSYSQSERKF